MSPSRIERLLACPLRIAFEQAHGQVPARKGQRSAFATVGLAVHRTIEFFLGEGAFSLDNAWNVACQELNTTGPDPRAAPGARRARLRLERRLPELLTYIESRRPTKLCMERELASPGGEIVGAARLLVLGALPSIVDYKTGVVEVDGRPRRSSSSVSWRVLCLARDKSARFRS